MGELQHSRESAVRGWKRTVKLKDLLSDDDSAANARRIAGLMAARLKRLPYYEEGGIDDFSSTVEEFEGIATSTAEDYDEDWTVLRHFNACMSALYDWADAERVWIA